MPELPEDLPRLWTIKRYLLLLLADVDKAIETAENGSPRGKPPPPRWCIQWRHTPVGTPRLGILHHAGCWMATGDRLTIREVQALRQDPGRRIERCEACGPGQSTEG
ncbi:hypothetical protein K378_01482 [Streptomyces sp. Amel2xB2]|uniref:DUF6233 domain-containing protein n=1 Tax=Streptomyces sp. Amel2xB2 TaxID=1305829 RepID=UPI000DB99BF6|nr:hypothetical protein [Streptomyces sp. Amel2xB2]RAJ70317.1 hypothetical protein K378_01482 [Streptomyces sp. Amel2xB2]